MQGGRTYKIFCGLHLPLIVRDIVRRVPDISDEDLQALGSSQAHYELEEAKRGNGGQNTNCDAKYGWRGVLLVTVVSVLTYGDPDILDGLIHWLMNN